MADPDATYRISDDGRSITCCLCGMTSHNPNDVRERYCGRCHIFHDDAAVAMVELQAYVLSSGGVLVI